MSVEKKVIPLDEEVVLNLRADVLEAFEKADLALEKLMWNEPSWDTVEASLLHDVRRMSGYASFNWRGTIIQGQPQCKIPELKS